jgi:hypothetical protein
MDLNTLSIPESAQRGRWFREGDAEFLVASIDSKPYQDALEDAMLPHRELLRRSVRRGAKPSVIREAREVRHRCTVEAMASHILLDWKNVTDGGKPVKFSREAALAMMQKYRKFADLIADMATGEFDDQEAADAEGIENLKNG